MGVDVPFWLVYIEPTMNAATEIFREAFNITACDMMNFAVRVGLTDAVNLALLVHNHMPHHEHPLIAPLLERCRTLETHTIGRGAQNVRVTTYSTPNGIVEFRDYQSGGWTMLTECPSAKVSDSAAELEAMLDKHRRVGPRRIEVIQPAPTSTETP